MSDTSKASVEMADAEKGAAVDIAGDPITATSNSRKITGVKWFLVVFSMLSAVFLFSLDNTIVADLIPILVNKFQHVDLLSWLSVGFTIGAVVLALSFGLIYALFDAKWLFMGSTVLFLGASALCGGAPNMPAEIVGRVLAGVGGNGMYLGTLTLMIVHTTDKERSGYLALIGIVWGFGTVLGPVVGGGFAIVGWRWAFFINPMIGAFVIVICFFCLPKTDPVPDMPYSTRFKKLDYVGSLLFTAAFTLLVVAINLGGTTYLWSSGATIAFFVVSGVLFIIFAVQQTFCVFVKIEDRLFPVQFLTNRNANLLFVCMAAVNTAAFVPIYYIPIYFQFTRGDSALESAVRLLPLIFLLSATVFTNGQLMPRLGSFQDWYIVGSVLVLIGGVLMSRIDTTTSTSAIYGFEVLLALGSGAYVQAGYTVIYLFVDPKDGSYAVSFMTLAQLGGIAVGLSLAGAVFVNEAVDGLVPLLPQSTRTDIEAAVSGTSSDVFTSLSPEDQQTALVIIVDALRKVFIPVYVAGAVGLVCCLFITRKNISKIMKGMS